MRAWVKRKNERSEAFKSGSSAGIWDSNPFPVSDPDHALWEQGRMKTLYSGLYDDPEGFRPHRAVPPKSVFWTIVCVLYVVILALFLVSFPDLL